MTSSDESGTSARRPHVLCAILREPLVQFALLAAIPFALHAAFARAAEAPREPIVLTDAMLDELALRAAERVGERPESMDREALAGEFRREEALYREALRLGLDRGDAIVRRRLVQKVELVLESRVEVPEPDDTELARFLDAHRDRLRMPGRVRLDQVFFAGDAAAERASATLRELGPEAAVSAMIARGDAFPLGASHGPLALSAIEARLGRALAAAARTAPLATWTGPVESEWGAHLVRVDERSDAIDPPLEAIRAQVARAWREAQRERAVAEAVDALVERWAEAPR